MTHKLFITTLSTLIVLAAGCKRPITVEPGPDETGKPSVDVPAVSTPEWAAFRARNYVETYRDGFEMARDAATSAAQTPVTLAWIAPDGAALPVTPAELAAAKAQGSWKGYRVDDLSVVQGSGDIAAIHSAGGGLTAPNLIVHNDVRNQLTASQGMFTIASTNADQSHTTVIGEAHDIVALASFN